MVNHLKKLFNSGLLRPNELLSSDDLEHSCSVSEDGALNIPSYPHPIHSLRTATRLTQEHMIFGFHMNARNFKTVNPLFFWSYHDETTNRDEKLSRLWALCNSSFEHSPLGCLICMDIAPDPQPSEDIFVTTEIRPWRQVIAPRKHFTSFEGLPNRDRRGLMAALHSEVQRLLEGNDTFAVKKTCNKQGHFIIEITFHTAEQSGTTYT